MTPVEIIAKKRDGGRLSKDEIAFFINSFISEKIKDYQMSAFLMAVYLRGMDYDETGWLTEVMLESGRTIAFPEPKKLYVDKHSTGGVGDKVSLFLAPWVAACGAKVPMLSGRGLGHTGGTLDKLESIPGFRTDLSINEFLYGVEKVGCIITGQTPEIAPADRLMYALRDVTATVESIPLICGSILSKKFAAGPSGLVFDIKCGSGAFMKDMGSAEVLGRNLIEVSRVMGRAARAIITDMNQPLGNAAGNLLEVRECIDALRGSCPADLYDVAIEVAVEMLEMAGIEKNRRQTRMLLESKLKDGSAFRKFEEMVQFQGGNLSIFLNDAGLPRARHLAEFKAPRDGYVQSFQTERIGRLVVEMGGGRLTKDDIIDPLVGLIFHRKIGSEVRAGESLAEIHAQDRIQAEQAAQRLSSYITIGDEKPPIPELIKKRLS
jgi:pyrimidine-nucleoside phosphorylase